MNGAHWTDRNGTTVAFLDRNERAEADQGGLGIAPRRTLLDASRALADQTRYARGSVGTHYEAIAGDMWRAMRRRFPLLILFAALGLVLAIAAYNATSRSYVATAAVKLGFTRPDTNVASAAAGANVAREAISVVESEARILRMPVIARRVARRLELNEDPGYTNPGVMDRLESLLSGRADTLSETVAIERAAKRLSAQLTVHNDSRSYIILIEAEADTPERAAEIANAFAYEYLEYRTDQQLREDVATARTTVRVSTDAYSDKHPVVAAAQRELRVAEARLRDFQEVGVRGASDWTMLSGNSLVEAEPGPLESGQDLKVYIALGIFGGAFFWVLFSLVQERRSSGLRSEHDVVAATGAPCIAMIPRTTGLSTTSQKLMRDEALKSMSLSAGLEGVRGIAPRVLLATSALPESGSTATLNALAESLAAEGRRVLLLNLTAASHWGKGASLDEALAEPDRLAEFAEYENAKGVVSLRRKSGLNGGATLFTGAGETSAKLLRLIDKAVEQFDHVIIETPPALLFLDAALVAARADVSLFFAKWNATPVDAVSEAVARLEEHGVRIDGVALTEVDLDQYHHFVPNGRTVYLRRYQKFYERMARA